MLTDAEARALGERWVRAGGGWGSGGMLARHVDTRAYPLPVRTGPMEQGADGWWPDLRDSATRGAALEVVRERWGVDDLAPQRTAEPTEEGHASLATGQSHWGVPHVGGWNIRPRTAKETYIAGKVGLQPSEGVWLVAALEAAPR